MARKPKQLDLGDELPPVAPGVVQTSASPVVIPIVPVKAMVEFNLGTEAWCCKRFDMLAAELDGLTVALLPRLVAALQLQDHQWMIARRIFGLQPRTPPTNYPIEDMRIWSQEELAAHMGIKKADQMLQEIQAVRGVWEASKPKVEGEIFTPPATNRFLQDNELLKKYDLNRTRFRDQAESAKFLDRVRDMEKLLSQRMTAALTINLLNTELQMRRLDERLTEQDAHGEEWRKNMKMRSDLQATYSDQLEQLNKLAPWAGTLAGSFSFQGVVSEITKAIQEYQASGATALIDGIFTATEVQVMCRRSVQAPQPQYRFGWTVHALEARARLWDRNFRSTIPLATLKILDKAAKEAIVKAGQEAGEVVIDLEKDGEQGEYPPLLQAPNINHRGTENTEEKTI